MQYEHKENLNHKIAHLRTLDNGHKMRLSFEQLGVASEILVNEDGPKRMPI